jgi:surface antigen
MRCSPSFAALAAAVAATLSVVAAPFLSVGGAMAAETKHGSAACTCADKDKQPGKPGCISNFPDLKATLNGKDEVAALEALQLALTEAADGATVVWRRQHGRLSGLVQPTSSFKDESNRVCRHIVMTLTSGGYSRKVEGIACRQGDGVWSLEG